MRYHMKKRLWTEEERENRKKMMWWLGLSIPTGAAIVSVILLAGIRLFLIALIPHVFNVVWWCRHLHIYIHRLKGQEREAFMRLFYRLAKYSGQDDIASMALAVAKMSKISKSEVSIVREFTLQHAGKFLGPVEGLPLRMPPSAILDHMIGILDKKLEELPPYLTSEYEWDRTIARHRYRELESEGLCTSR